MAPPERFRPPPRWEVRYEESPGREHVFRPPAGEEQRAHAHHYAKGFASRCPEGQPCEHVRVFHVTPVRVVVEYAWVRAGIRRQGLCWWGMTDGITKHMGWVTRGWRTVYVDPSGKGSRRAARANALAHRPPSPAVLVPLRRRLR